MLTQSYADFSMNINLYKFKNVVVTIKRTLKFITTLFMADTKRTKNWRSWILAE